MISATPIGLQTPTRPRQSPTTSSGPLTLSTPTRPRPPPAAFPSTPSRSAAASAATTSPPAPTFRVSLTLPVTCLICLARVKTPVICRNRHVFCDPCVAEWLKRKKECPSCRCPATGESAFLPVIGGDVAGSALPSVAAESAALGTTGQGAEALEGLAGLDWVEGAGELDLVLTRQKLRFDDVVRGYEDGIRAGQNGKKQAINTSPQAPGVVAIDLPIAGSSSEVGPDFRPSAEDYRQQLLWYQSENERLQRQVQKSRDDRSSIIALKVRLAELEKENGELHQALLRSDEFIEKLQATSGKKTTDQD
ncbi:hypothetical protein DFJ73DRAFT_773991 [Zopfochytrium polystomum]|nr:hypothetical protein DFJ73DRAFT_773991 [Zopfochytrium polystomum]